MNMAGLNPAQGGGPVGGGAMMMNNTGSPALPNSTSNPEQVRLLLNTYIYEYFLKHGHFDIARALVKEEKFDMRTNPKQSPGRRKDAEINGADDGMGMDMDGKDDIPEDLPRPSNIADSGHQSSGFLFEWFAVFSDIFAAHRGQNKMGPANQYLLQHQHMQRMRDSQQNQNLARPGMMPNQYNMRAAQLRNGMVNGDMRKSLTPQQLAALHQKANLQQQGMPRADQPEGDPNVRPGTPADGENGGSPSKRPRLEGQQQYNGGMMPNGRPGMPSAAQQGMMIQSGFNPQMNPAQFRQQNGGMPNKNMAGTMAAANGMMNMANPETAMAQAMNQFPEGIPDMYNRNAAMAQLPAGPNGQSGNHALQDYQMQLMLLEQQNKKRLMMARQEQHENTNPRDGPPMAGGVNMPPGMSPGNRASPNPADQMKRTPQMGGMPGSPSAGDLQGRSPANMGFMNGMQPQEYPAMFMKDGQQMMAPGGANMRPPTSVDMNQMNRPQQPNRMAGQFQGGQPMAQQASQGQPQPVGTPGQRGDMPPPSAPATGNSAQRNNQAASPANSNAPPTPSQTSKPNPKTKKGKEDTNRKRPQKKNSTANAPNTEENPPATPTPSTPVTPMHSNSFNAAGAKGQGPGVQQQNQNAQQNQSMPPAQQQMQQPDLGQGGTFPDFSAPDQNFNLDFSTLENTDVLENFDFDSFLNTSADDAFNFDGAAMTEFSMDGAGE